VHASNGANIPVRGVVYWLAWPGGEPQHSGGSRGMSLIKLEKMKPEIAFRIADILPQSNDEVRSIYAKERYTLTEQELKQILEIVYRFI